MLYLEHRQQCECGIDGLVSVMLIAGARGNTGILNTATGNTSNGIHNTATLQSGIQHSAGIAPSNTSSICHLRILSLDCRAKQGHIFFTWCISSAMADPGRKIDIFLFSYPATASVGGWGSAGGVGQDLEAAEVLDGDRSPYFVPNMQPGHFDQCPDTPWHAAQYTTGGAKEHLYIFLVLIIHLRLKVMFQYGQYNGQSSMFSNINND